MKVKCSFIYEIKEYPSFQEAKSNNIEIKSRKQFEKNFEKEIIKILDSRMSEKETISEVKAKIIERKDN